jgi:predicted DNA-binding transcriptional regulator AlpA
MSDLAKILQRSKPSLYRDLAAGKLPVGISLGRTRRWLRSEIEAWLASGCPDRASWEAMKAQELRGAPRR